MPLFHLRGMPATGVLELTEDYARRLIRERCYVNEKADPNESEMFLRSIALRLKNKLVFQVYRLEREYFFDRILQGESNVIASFYW